MCVSFLVQASKFYNLTEFSRADWSKAMVYESINHGNDVTLSRSAGSLIEKIRCTQAV